MAILKDLFVSGDARFIGRINVLESMYPIGSIYMSTASTNPSQLFGGTWEAFGQGRSLIGAGSYTDKDSVTKTFTGGTTGGSYNIGTHTHSFATMTSANNTTTSTTTGNTGDNTEGLTGGGTSGNTGGTSGGTGNWSGAGGNSGENTTSVFMTHQNDLQSGIRYYNNSDNRAAVKHSTNRRYQGSGSSTNGWANMHINMSHNHSLPSHSHTVPEHYHRIPEHTHSVAAHSHTFSHSHTIAAHSHTISGSTGHPSITYQTTANNLQPYQGVYMWKRTA